MTVNSKLFRVRRLVGTFWLAKSWFVLEKAAANSKSTHRFLLRLQLQRLEAGEKDLAVLEQRIQEKLKPYDAQLTLDEIPAWTGRWRQRSSLSLGVDMSVFPNVLQAASWAGVSPGSHESAGKRKSSRIPKGNVYLKTALVEAATAAPKAKGTYLRDKFYRLKARRGYKPEIRNALNDKGVGLSVGDWFDQTKLARAALVINGLLSARGSPSATVKATFERSASANTVNVVFEIDEGPGSQPSSNPH